MSIVKNNTSYDSVDYTIKRLSTVPNSQGTELPIIQYTHLTNAYYSVAVAKAGIILIRARIPSTATGYLFGYRGANDSASDNIFIRVEEQSGSKVVVWNLNGTTIGSVPLDSDHFHEYGFVGGYAVYDYKKVNSSQSTPSVSGFTPANICGAKNNGANVAISEVYLARVDFHSFLAQVPETYETPYLCRFYPTTGNDGYMHNAMRLVYANIHPTTLSGGTIEGGPVLTEPYGIQLDDIRYLTRLGYTDALALICADGGVDERAGQSSPESAYTAIAGHYFAFDLSNTPTPSGPTPPPTYAYLEGKLRAGRKPNWDIWNDCIARGFYVRNDNGTYKLEFNIFKLANGLWEQKIPLEMFDGYNTAEGASHYPNIETTSDNVIVPFHNGQNYECSMDNLAVGHIDAWGDLTYPDDEMLFYVRNVADFTFKAVSGNAIPFAVPKAVLQANPDCDYYVYGIGAQLVIDSDPMASSVEKETKFICADNHTAQELAALKTKYRETGVGGTLVLNYLCTIFRNKLVAAGSSALNGLINLVLKGKNHSNQDIDITMPDFMGSKAIQVSGLFNQKLYEGQSTNGRKFVSESIASGRYLAYNELIHAPYAEITGDPKILLLEAHECNAEGTALSSATADDYFAFVTLEQSKAATPNMTDNIIYGLVQGRKFEVDNSVNPYTAGTVNHAIYQHVFNNLYLRHRWYKGTFQINNSADDANSIHFALSTLDKMPDGTFMSFTEAELAYDNLRYDIFNAARHPRLARFNGNDFIPKADTINMHGDDGCVLTLRTPVQKLHDGNSAQNNIVLNMYMQKYKFQNNVYNFINEGPDSGQTAPYFKQYVYLRKNGTVVAKFQFYESRTPNYWDFVYNSSTRSYSHPEGYETMGGVDTKYRCTIDFIKTVEDFIDPNGNGKSKAYYGLQWFYSLNISFKNGSSDADYPQAGDIFDVTFSDN